MTRKHFEALAARLAFNRPDVCDSTERKLQWEQDVRAVADVCAGFNGNFDRGRFHAAAGLPITART